jgi:hypothetical protein
MTETTLFLPGLSPVSGKTITATFDGGTLSSNGGVLILREIEKRLGLATVLSRHIPDDRDGRRVRHSYSDMTRARMFAIASGHEDCDDLDVLRSDPALKMACGRLPVSGTDLMSQPTLSRLENAPCWRQLARMGLELIDLFCARFERVPRCIVLDIDDTDDAVHGQQQLALFNTHAGGYCFQPIKIFEATTGRPVLSLLRPGKRPSGEEIERILRHVIGRIHRNWPAVEIMVRGDSHFATPEVMDLLEQKRCGYIFGLSTNMRLTEIGRPWGVKTSPHAERYQNRKKCGASFRPAMPQPAGASPARSSPASKPASKAATYASSSPICQAGQKCSTKRSIARADAWRISSRT